MTFSGYFRTSFSDLFPPLSKALILTPVLYIQPHFIYVNRLRYSLANSDLNQLISNKDDYAWFVLVLVIFMYDTIFFSGGVSSLLIEFHPFFSKSHSINLVVLCRNLTWQCFNREMIRQCQLYFKLCIPTSQIEMT